MKTLIYSKVNLPTLLICALLLNAGCASIAQDKINPVDPYEAFNRPVHKFNSKVDSYVAKPLADAYKWITPEFLQKGVNNFFNNLQDVSVILNDILQAKFKQSAQDAGRLTLNTTLGLAGLFDVASKAGLEKHNEDFGQTLAVWGLPRGTYLVLPFLGPSTLRELPGYVVDTATNPASYLGGFALPLASVSALNSRANAEGSLQFINEAALDPYVFMRESYLQWRNYQAADGQVKQDKATEDFENDLLGDDVATPKTPTKTNGTIKSPTAATPKIADTPKPSYEEAKRAFNEANSRLEKTKRALNGANAKPQALKTPRGKKLTLLPPNTRD
jgi:phospholipid-binding lipoprotein MlaA